MPGLIRGVGKGRLHLPGGICAERDVLSEVSISRETIETGANNEKKGRIYLHRFSGFWTRFYRLRVKCKTDIGSVVLSAQNTGSLFTSDSLSCIDPQKHLRAGYSLSEAGMGIQFRLVRNYGSKRTFFCISVNEKEIQCRLIRNYGSASRTSQYFRRICTTWYNNPALGYNKSKRITATGTFLSLRIVFKIS